MQNLIFPTFDQSLAPDALPLPDPGNPAVVHAGQAAATDTRVVCDQAFPGLWSLAVGEVRSLGFKVYFKGKAEAEGRFDLKRTGADSVEIQMVPTRPRWAVGARAMNYRIGRSAAGLRVVAAMALPPAPAAAPAAPQNPLDTGLRPEPTVSLSLGTSLQPGFDGFFGRVAVLLDPVAQLLVQGDYAFNADVQLCAVRLGLNLGALIAGQSIRVYGGPLASWYFPSSIGAEGVRFCGGLGGMGGVEFALSPSAGLYLEFGGGFGYSDYQEDLTGEFGGFFRGGLTLLRF